MRISLGRFEPIIVIALLFAGMMTAIWLLSRGPGPSVTMLTNLRTVICTPSRRLPGGELPEPPRGWHYRPDDRLESDAQ